MELFDLQNALARNECPKFLIFAGDDYAMINLYLDMISKKLELVRHPEGDINNVFKFLMGVELFPENKLFIMRYPKELVAKEDVWSGLEEKLGDNMLIMIFNDLDKRTKFYTQNKDIIVNFAPQDDKTFVSMVKSQTKMSTDSIKELGKICGNNYGKFLSEYDKIKNYSTSQNISEDDSLKHLIASGTIYTGNRDVIFEFVNRVMGAKSNMYELYQILKLQGESNMKLISLLYTAMRNQFIVQTVADPNPNSTGLQQFTINISKGRRGIYKDTDLRTALHLLQKVEQGIKMGLFEESFVIDYFLAELLL